jgi:cyclic-di-AMP phosphodiesterase PgpH
MSDAARSAETPLSELEQARRLLSATAIRALAEDRWSRWRPWLDAPVFVVIGLFLLWLLAPGGFDRPQVPPVDSIARVTVRAAHDVSIENRAATEAQRTEAAAQVRPLFLHDTELYVGLIDRTYLAVKNMAARRGDAGLSFADRRNQFQAEIGRPVSNGTFELVEKLDEPLDLANAIAFFLNFGLDRPVIADKAQLPANGGLMVNDRRMGQVTTPAALAAVDLAQLRRLMRARAADAPFGDARVVRSWIVDAAAELARENLVPDPAGTEALRRQAAQAVTPVVHRLSAGEVVVRRGDRVSAEVRERLAALADAATTASAWRKGVPMAVLLGGLLLLGALLVRGDTRTRRLGRKSLYTVLSVVVAAVVLALAVHVSGRGLLEALGLDTEAAGYLMPIALVPLVLAPLIADRVGSLAGIAMATALVFRTDGDLAQFAVQLVGVLVATLLARRCRRRGDLIRAGAVIGLIQALAVAVVTALSGATIELGLLLSMAAAVLGGGLAAGLAMALLPLMETAFNETTDMRLLELAGADRPLLKHLALHSPGTYYHSLVMGNLAEAAGDAIGANALRCRVMALYHDIGKTVRPSYFAENQRGANIHDRLPPELSARIIFAHIKDGIDIARKHRLGRPIIDAITQHQGTTLLRIFYQRAVERAAATGAHVDEAEFRYPGPKPRTREAAILLLADATEAATRALKDPSPAEITARVRKVIEEKRADGQLDDCPLTMADLTKIEAAFVRVLTLGVYHSRIEYPPVQARPNSDDRTIAHRPGDAVRGLESRAS